MSVKKQPIYGIAGLGKWCIYCGGQLILCVTTTIPVVKESRYLPRFIILPQNIANLQSQVMVTYIYTVISRSSPESMQLYSQGDFVG